MYYFEVKIYEQSDSTRSVLYYSINRIIHTTWYLYKSSNDGTESIPYSHAKAS